MAELAAIDALSIRVEELAEELSRVREIAEEAKRTAKAAIYQ